MTTRHFSDFLLNEDELSMRIRPWGLMETDMEEPRTSICSKRLRYFFAVPMVAACCARGQLLPGDFVTFRTIAVSGDAVPGQPDCVFQGFDLPAVINDSGDIAFVASFQGDSCPGKFGAQSAIWRMLRTGSLEKLVQVGDPIEGVPGATYSHGFRLNYERASPLGLPSGIANQLFIDAAGSVVADAYALGLPFPASEGDRVIARFGPVSNDTVFFSGQDFLGKKVDLIDRVLVNAPGHISASYRLQDALGNAADESGIVSFDVSATPSVASTVFAGVLSFPSGVENVIGGALMLQYGPASMNDAGEIYYIIVRDNEGFDILPRSTSLVVRSSSALVTSDALVPQFYEPGSTKPLRDTFPVAYIDGDWATFDQFFDVRCSNGGQSSLKFFAVNGSFGICPLGQSECLSEEVISVGSGIWWGDWLNSIAFAAENSINDSSLTRVSGINNGSPDFDVRSLMVCNGNEEVIYHAFGAGIGALPGLYRGFRPDGMEGDPPATIKIVEFGEAVVRYPGFEFRDDSFPFASNVAGDVVFYANLQRDDGIQEVRQSLWASKVGSDELIPIVVSGDLFDVNDDPLITESWIIDQVSFVHGSGGQDGYARGLNDRGDVVFRMRLVSPTGIGSIEGLFVANIGNSETPPGCTGPCSLADYDEAFCVLDINDILMFADSFNSGDPAADLFPPGGGDGMFDINDVLVFASAFNQGCP